MIKTLNKWKDISSAPKDGTKILGFGKQGWNGNYKDYKNKIVQQVIYWGGDEDEECWHVDTCSYYVETLDATHWKELPDNPIIVE